MISGNDIDFNGDLSKANKIRIGRCCHVIMFSQSTKIEKVGHKNV